MSRCNSHSAIAGSLVAAAILSGCSATPDTGNNSSSAPDLSGITHHVYAHLEKTDDGYAFTEFRNYSSNTEGWVNLTDLQPLWSTKSTDCSEPLGECESNSDLFMEAGMNLSAGRSAGYLFLGVFTGGIGLFAVPMEVTFDQDAYLDAVNEAAGKLPGYKEELLHYNKVVTSKNAAASQIEEKHQRSEAPVITARVKDESGLYIPKLFASSLPTFTSELAELPVYFVPGQSAEVLPLLTHKFEVAANQRLSDMEAKIGRYEVECTEEQSILWVGYRCPKEPLKAGEPHDISVSIYNIDFDAYSGVSFDPVVAERNDDNVEVIYVNDQIRVRNLSDRYIKVRNATFAYAGDLRTFTNLDTVVPPGAKDWLVRDLDDVFDSKSELADLTMDRLKTESVRLGVGIEYEVAGRVESLFKRDTFELADIDAFEKLYGI